MSGFGWVKLKSIADWRLLGADQQQLAVFSFWLRASAKPKPVEDL